MCRRVLELDPANLDALRLLSELVAQLGPSVLPDELVNRAIDCQSADPVLLNRIGILLNGHERLEQAARSFRAALAVQPGFVDAHHNLGNTLQSIGRFDEAEQHLRQALVLNPNMAEAHNSLGNLLLQLARHSEAEQHFRTALRLNPDYADACNNLGILLSHGNQPEEAEQFLRKALALRPDAVAAHNNLALVLDRTGRHAEAEQCCRNALAISPRSAVVYDNLGVILQRAGQLAVAEQSFRKALELNPGYTDAQAHWVHVCQILCAWSEDLTRSIDLLRQHVVSGGSGKVPPFNFLALPGTDAREQYECARQFAAGTLAEALSRLPMHGEKRRGHRTKLRIGYLSADFYEHATSYLVAEVLERHDRARFEVFGYSFGPDDNSPMRARVRAAVGIFRDIRNQPHDQSAHQIVSDEIDILVDLKGYTSEARPQITALRPAPVQINWLGYPGTLGHTRLADYLIGDPVVTPLDHAAYYSESLALMPHCYQPNDRQRALGSRPTRLDVGLPKDGFVFCCFNQSYKITPAMFDIWCSLLNAVPGSLLWLLEPAAEPQANLRREAEARGVSAGRILFAPKLPLSEHLGRLQLADLALDTFPYTSHTTASDALWAGVPLVTIMGATFVSRIAASILSATGLPELIANDPASYHRLSLELALQPEYLGKIRTKLDANRLTCPLFDSTQFTRNLERLYEVIWLNYCVGNNLPITA